MAYGWDVVLVDPLTFPYEVREKALAQLARLAAYIYAECVKNNWKIMLLSGHWNKFSLAIYEKVAEVGVEKGRRIVGYHVGCGEGHGSALNIAIIQGDNFKFNKDGGLWSDEFLLATLIHELAHFNVHEHNYKFFCEEKRIKDSLEAGAPYDEYPPAQINCVWRPDTMLEHRTWCHSGSA